MKKQTFELFIDRLSLVVSSISCFVSRIWRSKFFVFSKNSFERTGTTLQLGIIVLAVTTLWVSGLSNLPFEGEIVIETASEMPVAKEDTLSKLETDNNPLPEIEPMQLSAVRSDFDSIIGSISRELGVDPALVKAVVHSESAFDQFAVSSRGANGLMQLMPETAERFAITDPFNAEQNIRGGVRFLKHLLLTFENDERLALAAYNAGPGRVLYYGGVPPFVETYTYVHKVLELRKIYAQIYSDSESNDNREVVSLEVSIST